ncbi:phosphonate transport system substrate-binding protein [Oceanibaculum indicum]|nr:phosphonate transport system substrate-binding protein [Oceanibaculum indicum]
MRRDGRKPSPAATGWRTERREFLKAASLAAASLLLPSASHAADVGMAPRQPIRFGLTPVFLTNDLLLLEQLQAYLEKATGHPVQLVTRRSYQEITSLLLAGQIDLAWICGFPYAVHRDALDLVAVPVWKGQPLYRSYLICGAEREVTGFEQLAGDTHAYSDPDSNSGYLVTRALITESGHRPDSFFAHSFFTYGHRNVVRAVSTGLAQSGSVDGYVWDVLSETEPALTRGTRIVRQSELLGFPPVAALKEKADSPELIAARRALLDMAQDEDGRAVLAMLRLDGFQAAEPALFDRIAAKVALVGRLG